MTGEYKLLPTDKVKDPARPMRSDVSQEGVDELVQSIKQVGIIEPLVVIRKDKAFEVVAGHRRLYAAEVANLTEVPCIVIEAKGIDAEVLKVHENLAREKINAVDWAIHLDYLKQQYKLTDSKLSELLGMSQGWVSQHLEILSWPPEMIAEVKGGRLSFSSARELAGIKSEDKRRVYVDAAVRGGVTPSLAKRWRQQANTIPLSYPDDQVNSTSGGVPTPIPTNEITCLVCGEPVPFEESVTITIHSRCRPNQ